MICLCDYSNNHDLFDNYRMTFDIHWLRIQVQKFTILLGYAAIVGADWPGVFIVGWQFFDEPGTFSKCTLGERLE